MSTPAHLGGQFLDLELTTHCHRCLAPSLRHVIGRLGSKTMGNLYTIHQIAELHLSSHWGPQVHSYFFVGNPVASESGSNLSSLAAQLPRGSTVLSGLGESLQPRAFIAWNNQSAGLCEGCRWFAPWHSRSVIEDPTPARAESCRSLGSPPPSLAWAGAWWIRGLGWFLLPGT